MSIKDSSPVSSHSVNAIELPDNDVDYDKASISEELDEDGSSCIDVRSEGVDSVERRQFLD